MSKCSVAVCDGQESYSGRFASYLIKNHPKETAVSVYSETEAFDQALREQTFDVAVLGRGFEDFIDETVQTGTAVLHLSEDMPKEPEQAADESEEKPAVRHVFRYQPMDVIWHEIQILAGGKSAGRTEAYAAGRRMEVIGVYAPGGHEMQTAFSIVTCALLAEKQKVLYVNLTEYSGFCELFDVQGTYDMGDMVLRLRSQRDVAGMFSRCRYEMEGFSYVLPFGNPANLHEFQPEDLERFLEFLQKETDFEVVLLDFGEGFVRFDRMLACCDGIYCMTRRGYYYDCRCRSFLEYLSRSQDLEKEECVQMLELPFSAKAIRGGGDVARQLLWSEFGDYVRGVREGAEHAGP